MLFIKLSITVGKLIFISLINTSLEFSNVLLAKFIGFEWNMSLVFCSILDLLDLATLSEPK